MTRTHKINNIFIFFDLLYIYYIYLQRGYGYDKIYMLLEENIVYIFSSDRPSAETVSTFKLQ